MNSSNKPTPELPADLCFEGRANFWYAHGKTSPMLDNDDVRLGSLSGYVAGAEQQKAIHEGALDELQKKLDAAEAKIAALTAASQQNTIQAWEPSFDACSLKQQDLVLGFCEEIAGPRGGKGRPPDAVRLLEMAEALFKAERDDMKPSADYGQLPKDIVNALRFYANGEHLVIDEEHQEFDSVSGEPENWLQSLKDGDTTMVEDGSIARRALQGESLNWLDGEDDHTPKPVKGELFSFVPASD